MKIKVIEAFNEAYNGWLEVEFYGLEDLELLNQLPWKMGDNNAL